MDRKSKFIRIWENNKKKFLSGKDFIKTLPSNIFVLLKSKGCVNYSGFIKPIKLTSEEELEINTDILMSLYEKGIIEE